MSGDRGICLAESYLFTERETGLGVNKVNRAQFAGHGSPEDYDRLPRLQTAL